MNRDLYVVVAVDPFSRVSVGEPLPEETPMRHPFALQAYRLEAIPIEEFNKNELHAYHLPVGKIRMDGGLIQEIDQFIPPCATLCSHIVLQKFHEHSKKLLIELLADCVRIIQKIKKDRKNSVIAENLCYLSERLLAFLAENVDAYRLFFAEQAPLTSIDFFIKTARLTKSVLYCLPEREHLMRYFTQHTNFSPVEFENISDVLIYMEYDHLHLFEAVQQANQLIALLVSLFNKLSKLEYLDQRTDSIF
jgi:hypothetical protein